MIKVGIIGYGITGRRRQDYIDQNRDMDLVAWCDPKVKGGYQDYNSMIKDADLDAVFIATPNNVTAPATIAALEAGLHVFAEKPAAISVAELEKVREVEAKHPNQKLMYGFNHRYHQSIQSAKAMIESGSLGHIINMRGVYGKSGIYTFDQDDWRARRRIAGGGVLLDQGIHMVDLMRMFAGEFVDVQSYVANQLWTSTDVEDNAYAIMRTASGAVAMLHSSATQWKHKFTLEINLSMGIIVLDGLITRSGSYGQETLTWRRIVDNASEQTIRFDWEASMEYEIDYFANAITYDYRIENGNSSEALSTQLLVEKIYEQSR